MPLSFPLSELEAELCVEEGFSAGAARLALFFRKYEERADPADLLATFFSQCPSSGLLEYVAFSLTDIGIADVDVAREGLLLRRLLRLLMRSSSGKSLTDGEREVVRCCAVEMANAGPEQLRAAVGVFQNLTGRLFQGDGIDDEHRKALSFLLRQEAAAMKERIAWISANADPYSMRVMARILPRLSIYDERVKALLDLARAIAEGHDIGARVLSFAYRLKSDAFTKWISKLERRPELQPLVAILKTQERKLVPVLSLVALATIARWIDEIRDEKSGPLGWIRAALDSYDNGEFMIDAGPAAGRLALLASRAGLEVKGTIVHGSMSQRVQVLLIGEDLLTKPARKERERVGIKELVAASMRNESLLLRLLTNPKVYGTAGMVEKIARKTRSAVVLTAIARDKSLHTGQANMGVPLELLKNPTGIPITLLRPLVHVRYVRLSDLRALVRNSSGIRREVSEEVQEYLRKRA